MAINQPYVKLDSILKCNVGQRNMLSAALSTTVKEKHLHRWKCCWDVRPLKCLQWICQEENRLFTLTGLKSGDTATKAHGKRLFVFQTITWAGEMAQRVKVLAAKTERQSWTPGTHTAEGEWLLRVVLTPTRALVRTPLLLQKCNNTKNKKQKVALVKLRQEDCYKLMDKASLNYSIVYNI